MPDLTGFEQLGLSGTILEGIAELGWDAPSQMQVQMVPLVLDGKDVVCQARHGAGKTGAYILPILQRLEGESREAGSAEVAQAPLGEAEPDAEGEGEPNYYDPDDRTQQDVLSETHGEITPQAAREIGGQAAATEVRCLVLIASGGLCVRADEKTAALCAHTPFRTAVIFGGKDARDDERKLRRGPGVVIATPRGAAEAIQSRALRTDEIAYVVLDEADRMLFENGTHLRSVLTSIRSEHQTILIASTVTPAVAALAEEFTRQPVKLGWETPTDAPPPEPQERRGRPGETRSGRPEGRRDERGRREGGDLRGGRDKRGGRGGERRERRGESQEPQTPIVTTTQQSQPVSQAAPSAKQQGISRNEAPVFSDPVPGKPLPIKTIGSKFRTARSYR